MLYSGYKIISWKNDEDNTQKQIEEIKNIAKIEEVSETNEYVEIIEQEEKPGELNPYWAFIDSNLLSVDFNDLKEVNSDITGWIEVKGCNVNYPFVQTNDNKYYLNHSLNKSNNSAGWVFLDYRNDSNLNDKNNIIYAHGRAENTMFGSLRTLLTDKWIKDKNNYLIRTSTPEENMIWQIFSVYKIEPTSDYLKTSFSSDDDFKSFTDTLINRSVYNFETNISKSDKILTLSTCYDNNYRMVVHAKLIKKEKRI